MLKISSEQMMRLADERRREVARLLAGRMAARHAGALKVWTVDDLAKALHPELARAHALGMRSMRELERWTDLVAVLGFGFSETEAWAAEALERLDLSPRTKLAHLEETAVFVVLAKAR